MKVVKIREKCFRVEHGPEWGIVEFNGSEWRAEIAFYQAKGSRGKIVKPMSQRRPRYRRVGFYANQGAAIDALALKLAPSPLVNPKFAERYAHAKIRPDLYGRGRI